MRCEECNALLWDNRCPNGCGDAPEAEEMSPCTSGGYIERPLDDHEGDD